MRKKLISGLGFLVTTTMSGHTSLIVEDQFLQTDYTVGQLSAQAPAIAGTTGGFMFNTNAKFVATGLDYSDPNYLKEAGGSIQIPSDSSSGRQGRILLKPFTASSNTTVYISFLMQTGIEQSRSYRAFELHNGGFDDQLHRMLQIGFQDGDFNSAGKNYGFRISKTDQIRSLGINDAKVNLFVIKLVLSSDSASDSVTVFHNPDLTSGDNPTSGVTLTGLDIAFDRVSFAKFGSLAQVSFDEFRMGETFTDVTGAAPKR